MNYRIVNINPVNAENFQASILIIYTGGTIGMIDDNSGTLVSFNFKQIKEKIPSLKNSNLKLTVISFPVPIDSSDIKIEHWLDIGYIIYENYNQYDGFVVLHGTDTMAYSASALSFILEGLNKPVIFTGAQLPIGATRSDARRNLTTALEMASIKEDGKPLISEVCIYFGNVLLRGNRAKKVQSVHFDAFESANYPCLAEAGVLIDYNTSSIRPFTAGNKLKYHNKMDNNVAILKVFPGLNRNMVESIVNTPQLRGLVMETFGSGNATRDEWFINCLQEAIEEKGIVVFNVTQCLGGKVIMGKYETSKGLKEIGVLSGNDITTEAAITKMMFVLGKETSRKKIEKALLTPLAGEMDE